MRLFESAMGVVVLGFVVKLLKKPAQLALDWLTARAAQMVENNVGARQFVGRILMKWGNKCIVVGGK